MVRLWFKWLGYGLKKVWLKSTRWVTSFSEQILIPLKFIGKLLKHFYEMTVFQEGDF